MQYRPLAVAVLLAVAGCATPEAQVDSTATAAPDPNVVAITTKDFSFDGPDTIPGGWTKLVLKNAGNTLHHIQLIRLTEGKTFDDLAALMKSMKPTDAPPSWAIEAGGVNPPNPGAESAAILNIEPGNYAIVCFVDLPDRVPHVAKGMAKALTVTSGPSVAAAVPVSDITLTLNDYSFAFSTPPTQGSHVIKVENVGTQHHEVFIAKLDSGKTAEDLARWAATYQGPPPASALGGTSGFMPGTTEYVPVGLTSGSYVLLCFLPDVKDGKPHLEHGMVLPFTVN
ncbi:MAG: hypothetical protein MNPFHGCM_01994 [Gemmatimonadaceae bacterium]|nr:hypothetical protein [Gemmatimonadaceae bacterium]